MNPAPRPYPSRIAHSPHWILAFALAALAGCASPPPAPPAPPPEPTASAAPAPCPAAPPCPGTVAPEAHPLPPPAAPEPRGWLEATDWGDLIAWGEESLAPALEALLRTCEALAAQPPWEDPCQGAAALTSAPTEAGLRAFFEAQFTPHRVVNADGSLSGLITGYYEPLLYGSRTPSARYRYPLYRAPDDLLEIDLSAVYPDLKGRRLRGRLDGRRVIPYPSRGEIESAEQPLKGHELVWVDDAVDAMFLHIQGSGQVKLDNGDTLRVGYSDQNGHPFKSVARYLISRRELRPEQASMQGIKAWAQKNRAKLEAFLNFNPSYVFFRELPLNLPGPLGTLQVPLTAERSVAVDPRVVPLGVPVYLATTWPNSRKPLNRLMLAQDTGGAIAGAVRADFFWGFGEAAGKLAGVMKQTGRMWVLLPKGYQPPGE